MPTAPMMPWPPMRRAPYGARGLKYRKTARRRHRAGRAPYGARGLKSLTRWQRVGIVDVAPRMGRVD